jgi:hypothetical protein
VSDAPQTTDAESFRTLGDFEVPARWPKDLVKELFGQADWDWGYDWETFSGIVGALDAVARVCPKAGEALRAWTPNVLRVEHPAAAEERRKREAPQIFDMPEADHA